MVTRKRWIAVLLSLLLPGLGQLYSGYLHRCLFFGALSFLFLFLRFWAYASWATLVALITLWGIIWIWCICDAARGCRQPVPLQWFSRWPSLLLFWLALVVPYSLIDSHFEQRWYQAFTIPTESSFPALRIGDLIMVDKRYYNSKPLAGGDLIVLTPPDTAEEGAAPGVNRSFVRRIIALAGDTVEVRGQQVYLNDEPLAEPYAHWGENTEPMDFPRTLVPEERLFVLGDNRAHAKDSRFWRDPFVPYGNVTGKVLYIYFSHHDWKRSGMGVQ